MNVKAEAVISFDGLDEATRKVRWLQRLGKDSGSSSWSVPRGRRSKHSLGVSKRPSTPSTRHARDPARVHVTREQYVKR